MADYTFKVIVIGQAGVGKTAIVRRFIRKVFPENQRPTIGIDIGIKLLEIDGKKIQLKIWDSAGSERFRSLATSYYRNADAAILVYGINDSETIYELQTWSNELNNNDSDLVKFLVGNKNDLIDEREVSQEIAINFALLENIDLAIECSAKIDDNINYLFYTLAKRLLPQSMDEELPRKENMLRYQSASESMQNLFVKGTPVKAHNEKKDTNELYLKKAEKNIFQKFCSLL